MTGIAVLLLLVGTILTLTVVQTNQDSRSRASIVNGDYNGTLRGDGNIINGSVRGDVIGSGNTVSGDVDGCLQGDGNIVSGKVMGTVSGQGNIVVGGYRSGGCLSEELGPSATPIPPTVAPTTVPSPTTKPSTVPTTIPTTVPTNRPTVAPSTNPTVIPTVLPTVATTTAPTTIPTLVPTITGVPNETALQLSVFLHGIGYGGDSASPGSQGNLNPVRTQRNAEIQVFNAQNQLVITKTALLTYNSAAGKFDGLVNLGPQFSTGFYSVKVNTDQYLRGLVEGIQTITKGQTQALPKVTLVAGDVNGDNLINIVDYNLLVGCYSDLLPAVDCTQENTVLTDFNDDGKVNQLDYNLFLRELTNIGGQ